MTTSNDNLLHLVQILEQERNNSKAFAKRAKAEKDMDSYNYFHGEEGAYNYTLNYLKKLVNTYQLKGCKTTTARKTIKRK